MNPKHDKSNLNGIILTGGKSSRMGQDKGLMDLNGKKLIEYPINLLSKFCDNIIISTNDDQYKQFGYPTIADRYPGMGPAAGMISSLLFSKTSWNLVVSCDMPFLEEEFIDELLYKLNSLNSGFLPGESVQISSETAKDELDNLQQVIQCIVPVHKENIEPLAALYHRSFSHNLEQGLRTNQRALYQTIGNSNVSYYDTSLLLVRYPNLFVNINSREEYEYWQAKGDLKGRICTNQTNV